MSCATAKRDLRAGEMLDGEGGGCVWGKLLPAPHQSGDRRSADRPGQPRAAAARRAAGAVHHLGDVRIDETDDAYRYRREMERMANVRSVTTPAPLAGGGAARWHQPQPVCRDKCQACFGCRPLLRGGEALHNARTSPHAQTVKHQPRMKPFSSGVGHRRYRRSPASPSPSPRAPRSAARSSPRDTATWRG